MYMLFVIIKCSLWKIINGVIYIFLLFRATNSRHKYSLKSGQSDGAMISALCCKPPGYGFGGIYLGNI